MNKRDLSERDICTKFITPAIENSGWDDLSQIRENVYFTKGRIIVRGKLVTRGKAKFADYILYYKPNIPIALIEAKDNNHAVGDGMQQGLEYAATLDIPFVFSSNGDGFLLYPGAPIGYPGLLSSIRLEQAREGVEDYEYLHLLRRLVAEAKSAGRDTTEADGALGLAAELVTIPNAGGLQSSKILPDPEAVYRVREALASRIEQMTR